MRADYNGWVQDVEAKYTEIFEKRNAHNLKSWFESINKDDGIARDVKRLQEMTYDGKPEDGVGEDILLTAWAQAFHAEYYDEKNDVPVKGKKGHETYFNVTQRYGKALRNYWNGKIKMPFGIPEDKNDGNEVTVEQDSNDEYSGEKKF